MQKEIDSFLTYLHQVKKTSVNTELSYKRDLAKVERYLSVCGTTNVENITAEMLKSYVEDLKEQNFKPASISRNIASLKAFFHYLFPTSFQEE